MPRSCLCGGGFVIGSRRMKPMRYLAAHFVGAGIAVCAIDYRMIFRGGRLDEATDDVCDAFELWCCFGLYEIDHLHGPATLLPRFLFGTSDRDAWMKRSPRFAAQPAVPTLLLHGGDDGLVPVEQARRLAAHRES